MENVLTITALLHQRAKQQLDQRAYTFLEDGESISAHLSYAELDSRAKAIAAQLQAIAKPGSRALLLYPPGLDFIAAFFGCLYARVIAVPAYPPRRDRQIGRLQAIAGNCEATIALTTIALLDNIKSRYTHKTELAKLSWLATDALYPGLAQEWRSLEITTDTIAFVQYTSGSTGTPKGVTVSHGNLMHNQQLIQQAFGHSEESIVVGWLPLFHDMGLIGNMLQPLYCGIPCILMPPAAFFQKPMRWLNAIARYGATTSGGPNFAYDLCVQRIRPEDIETLDLSCWDVAFNGAEPIRAETLQRFSAAFAPYGFRQQAFYSCYGMAETTLMISGGPKLTGTSVKALDAAALERGEVVVATEISSIRSIVSCGQPCLDQTVKIVNPETCIECPTLRDNSASRIGEIWVAGPSVTQGYWNQIEATKQTFHAYLSDTGEGPFLRTGDLGFMSDGELFVTGRLKDLIIIRGRNHYPQDIERTVEESHSELRSGCGAAFSIDIEGEERLVVVQEVDRGVTRELEGQTICTAIREAISEQHELQVYAIALLKPASIPKTSSGKIQRYACRQGFQEGNLAVFYQWVAHLEHPIPSDEALQPHPPPAAITESGASVSGQPDVESLQIWLISRLSYYLKISPQDINIQTTFAAYGMDSSVALTIASELEDWLGREVDPIAFWEHPSIAALAQYLERGEA